LQSPRGRRKKHNKKRKGAGNLNFAEIEMPLAYLSIYFGVGRQGGKSIMNKLPPSRRAQL